MSKIIIIFFITTFCFLSCSKDQTIESTNESSNIATNNDQFKKEILSNLADNVILPNNQLLVDKALTLKLSSSAFTNNSNLSNLLIHGFQSFLNKRLYNFFKMWISIKIFYYTLQRDKWCQMLKLIIHSSAKD